MSTKKVANQTVYMCWINEEPYQKEVRARKQQSIKRMALHPMVIEDDDAEDIIENEFRDAEYKDERFNFRVVFCDNGKWRYSCLGIDSINECDCDYFHECDCDNYSAGDTIRKGTIDEALKWLLDGEKNMEKLLSLKEMG